MRTCPICHATCFDDMEVCFGCMHRFEAGADDVEAPLPKPHDSSLPAFGQSGCVGVVDDAVRHGVRVHEGKTAPLDMRTGSILQERISGVADADCSSGKNRGQSVRVPFDGMPYQIVINLQPMQ